MPNNINEPIVYHKIIERHVGFDVFRTLMLAMLIWVDPMLVQHRTDFCVWRMNLG